MIKPTIGRKVWYHPPVKGSMFNQIGTQPLDATVIYVHSDSMVNLFVIDHLGKTAPRTSVPLYQPDEPKPEGGDFCHWMPYQVGQAKKEGS